MLLPLLPEILLLALAGLVMGLDLAYPQRRSPPSARSPLSVVTALGFGLVGVATLLWARPAAQPAPIWGGLVQPDALAFTFQLLFLLAGLVTAILSADTPGLGDQGEYYALLIVVVLGLSLMALATDLVMLYLAVETASLVLYLLAGFLREDKSAEAGFKYFVFGAAASGIMLYGFSLLYGFTGQTNFAAIRTVLAAGQVPLPALVGSVILVIVGLGFKIAAVPFHFWAPDVYEGAPTPVTAFISVASKAAGFAMLARVLLVIFPAVQTDWAALLTAMTILTLTLGNVLAISQKNIKRLLAYSSIAQAGYALIGIVALSPAGLAATVFYLLMYTFTNLAVFGIVIVVTRAAGSDDIAAFAGLSRRSPALALCLLVGMLSLAGIPPLAGFMGKFLVFQAAVERGAIGLAFIGVLNAIVGLYYYLTIIKVAYLNPPAPDSPPLRIPRDYALALGVCVLGILVLGVWAAPWLTWATQAAQSLF